MSSVSTGRPSRRPANPGPAADDLQAIGRREREPLELERDVADLGHQSVARSVLSAASPSTAAVSVVSCRWSTTATRSRTSRPSTETANETRPKLSTAPTEDHERRPHREPRTRRGILAAGRRRRVDKLGRNKQHDAEHDRWQPPALDVLEVGREQPDRDHQGGDGERGQHHLDDLERLPGGEAAVPIQEQADQKHDRPERNEDWPDFESPRHSVSPCKSWSGL